MTIRGLWLAAGYLLCAVSAASILAWVLAPFIPVTYEKVLSRAVLLFCALGLLPLWRLAGLSAVAIGLLPAEPLRALKACVPGILVVLVPMVFFVVVQFRVWDDRVVYASMGFVALALGLAGSSVLVGLFEETLFRGLLYTAFRRRSGFLVSAFVSGVLYAAVHFIGRAAVIPEPAEITWFAGALVVFRAIVDLSGELSQWDSFLSLMLLGVLLAWVRERLGLWVCIGLHAAWVFAIRLFKEMTVRDVVSPYAATTGTYDNFVGHAVTVWLIFLFVVIALYRQYQLNLQRSVSQPLAGP